MSVETWKQEFYPTEAEDNIDDDTMALNHCIVKWKGLTEDNLKKHNLKKLWCDDDIVGIDGKKFSVNQNTCALCQIYYTDWCAGCPLIKMGFTMCGGDDPGRNDPYSDFYENNNPQPMIEALEKTLEFVKNNL